MDCEHCEVPCLYSMSTQHEMSEVYNAISGVTDSLNICD